MAGYQGSSTRRVETEAFDALIDARLRDMRFVMKAEVSSYSAGGQTASIQPKVSTTIGGKEFVAPVLGDIPVQMYRGGGYGFHLPLKPGNALTAFALDRPQTSFRENGGNSNAGQGRINDISNLIAFPGGYPDSAPMQGVSDDGMFVGSDDGKRGMRSSDDGSVGLKGGPSGSDKFVVNAAGKIDMKSESGDSLLDIIRSALVLIKDHLNAGAPTDSATQIAATALIAKIDGMKA